jgi:hypothetical protein
MTPSMNFKRESRTSQIEANKARAECDLAEVELRKDKSGAEAAEARARKE